MAERVIQGSRRPDGTFRKEIKVRGGFKTEELDGSLAYNSIGKQYRESIEPKVEPPPPSKQALKRQRQRERKEKEEKAGFNDVEKIAQQVVELELKDSVTIPTNSSVGPDEASTASFGSVGEMGARIRELRKKIKKIERWQSECTALTEGQRELVTKKDAFVVELAALEARRVVR